MGIRERIVVVVFPISRDPPEGGTAKYTKEQILKAEVSNF